MSHVLYEIIKSKCQDIDLTPQQRERAMLPTACDVGSGIGLQPCFVHLTKKKTNSQMSWALIASRSAVLLFCTG